MLLNRKAYAIALSALTQQRSRLIQYAAMSTEAGKNAGIMMILSPAKSLDLSPWKDASLQPSQADCDPSKTQEVAQLMKKRKEGELGKLLGISANLAKTAKDYWNDFDPAADTPSSKPCIYAFSGAAYQGLQIHECDEAAVSYMQKCLRIVDPLYGALRPLDQIQPYRLEMATRGVLTDKKIKLADYWSPSVTQHIARDLETFEDPILLNLASDEYSAAVDESALPENARYIKVVFKENGRVIAVHAKRARGMMVRYVAERQATSLDQVKEFAEEGYSFQEDASDETTLVFDREKQAAAAKRKTGGGAAKSTKKKSKR